MYSKKPSRFGYPSEQTQSGYYPETSYITEDELTFIHNHIQGRELLPKNTRIRKSIESTGGSEITVFDVLITASLSEPDTSSQKLYSDNQRIVKLSCGDHKQQLSLIIKDLDSALDIASNDTKQATLSCLIKSLRSEDMKSFKKSQEHWVRNKKPAVEVSHGFIKSYQDPLGVRASWQGLVAIVNREQSAVLSRLVDNASEIINRLPWNESGHRAPGTSKSTFENPTFVRPGFVSLDSESRWKSDAAP